MIYFFPIPFLPRISPPHTLHFLCSSSIIVDSNGECAALSMFALSEKHAALVGDREKVCLLVVDPVLKHITLKGGVGVAGGAGTPDISYKCVQVLHLDTFFVDGKPLAKELASAASSFSIEAFDR